jgi:hypothetical protein
MIKYCLVISLTVAWTLAAGRTAGSHPDSLHATAPHQAAQDHTEWIARSLKEMQTIKVGMTRRDLLMVFTTEGGLSTRTGRIYVYRECPNIKVDVEFNPVGPPGGTGTEEISPMESADDVITRISRPYLARSILD